MRKFVFLSIIAIAALALACAQAFARSVRISGTHSASEIKGACDKAGGTFTQDSGGYGCTTNCTASYGCTVGCTNKGKCTGDVPLRGRPSGTLGGILHPPVAGIKSSGDNPPSKAHRRPVNIDTAKPPSGVKTTGGNAQPVMRTHEHRSGGGKY